MRLAVHVRALAEGADTGASTGAWCCRLSALHARA